MTLWQIDDPSAFTLMTMILMYAFNAGLGQAPVAESSRRAAVGLTPLLATSSLALVMTLRYESGTDARWDPRRSHPVFSSVIRKVSHTFRRKVTADTLSPMAKTRRLVFGIYAICAVIMTGRMYRTSTMVFKTTITGTRPAFHRARLLV